MKRGLAWMQANYQSGLKMHLKEGKGASLDAAYGLGARALDQGLKTIDLAKFHEEAMISELLTSCPGPSRRAIIRNAGRFFTAAVVPMRRPKARGQEAEAPHQKIIELLSQRTIELAATKAQLSAQLKRGKAAEKELKARGRNHVALLARSNRQQIRLRDLSRKILSAHEDERRKISRELHDVIAQTLTGINLRLATLQKDAANSTKGLDRSIAITQRLVEKSVKIVHQFARELRPAVLDDLGLIPALESFLKTFAANTGLRTGLTAFSGVERLNPAQRTVLFRVIQEALTNVSRHAKASRVMVKLEETPKGVCATVSDDGKSFDVQRALDSTVGNRLGLLGMRERIEMVGGQFEVVSIFGKGTQVKASLPLLKRAIPALALKSKKSKTNN